MNTEGHRHLVNLTPSEELNTCCPDVVFTVNIKSASLWCLWICPPIFVTLPEDTVHMHSLVWHLRCKHLTFITSNFIRNTWWSFLATCGFLDDNANFPNHWCSKCGYPIIHIRNVLIQLQLQDSATLLQLTSRCICVFFLLLIHLLDVTLGAGIKRWFPLWFQWSR